MRPFDIKAFAVAALRRASYRTPMRTQVLVAARRARNEYRCAECGAIKGRREVAVDHIKPVVPTTGWDGFDGFIQRLFCATGGLQVLCKTPCHAAKTKQENAQRRKSRK